MKTTIAFFEKKFLDQNNKVYQYLKKNIHDVEITIFTDKFYRYMEDPIMKTNNLLQFSGCIFTDTRNSKYCIGLHNQKIYILYDDSDHIQHPVKYNLIHMNDTQKIIEVIKC